MADGEDCSQRVAGGGGKERPCRKNNGEKISGTMEAGRRPSGDGLLQTEQTHVSKLERCPPFLP